MPSEAMVARALGYGQRVTGRCRYISQRRIPLSAIAAVEFGRHARLKDLVIDAGAVCLGIAIVRCGC